MLVDHFGSGRGREAKQRGAKRHIPLNVVKVKLHCALVGKDHKQTPDIELGAYYHEHLLIIFLQRLLGVCAQDAVSGLVLEGVGCKLDPRKDPTQLEP